MVTLKSWQAHTADVPLTCLSCGYCATSCLHGEVGAHRAVVARAPFHLDGQAVRSCYLCRSARSVARHPTIEANRRAAVAKTSNAVARDRGGGGGGEVVQCGYCHGPNHAATALLTSTPEPTRPEYRRGDGRNIAAAAPTCVYFSHKQRRLVSCRSCDSLPCPTGTPPD